MAGVASRLCRHHHHNHHRRLQLNAAFVAMVGYSLYYLVLEPVAGLSWSLCVGLPLWLSASAFQQQVANAGLWALGVHVFSWYMQVRCSGGESVVVVVVVKPSGQCW